MRLSEKDREFLTTWAAKRELKIQFYLGIIMQVVLFALTYKLIVSYFTTETFDSSALLEYGIFGIVLGVVIAFFKYRANEKRYRNLKS